MEHVWWTREFLVTSAAKSINSHVVARLLQNQDDLGAWFGKYYGKDFGDKCSRLLREHINVAAALVGGDATAKDRWYQNADDITAYLGGVFHGGMLGAMMREHLDLTLQENLEISTGVTTNVATFDRIEKSANAMADMFAMHVCIQPWKFIGA